MTTHQVNYPCGPIRPTTNWYFNVITIDFMGERKKKHTHNKEFGQHCYVYMRITDRQRNKKH